MKYIIGLGNPGEEYTYTRHNIGFIVLQFLAKQFSFSDWKYDKYLNAKISSGSIDGFSFTFVLPQTFMNRSGETVSVLIKKNNLTIDDYVVIYDDLAFTFGQIKISHMSGPGGHNGVESIIRSVGKRFVRIRVGIVSVNDLGEKIHIKSESKSNFVLKNFNPQELLKIDTISMNVKNTLILFSKEGKDKAMTITNALL